MPASMDPLYRGTPGGENNIHPIEGLLYGNREPQGCGTVSRQCHNGAAS